MYQTNLGLLLQTQLAACSCLLPPCASGNNSHGEKGGPITWAVPSGSTTLPGSVFILSYVLGEFSLCVVVVASVLSLGPDPP